jgi:hypothetical protein
VPEQPPAKSKRGDVWLCGKHRVMCGDSTKPEDVAKLMAGCKDDLTFADPMFDSDDLSWLQIARQNCSGGILVMHRDKMAGRISTDVDFRYFLLNYYSFGFALSASMPQLAHHLIAVLGKPKFNCLKDGFKTVIPEQMERNRFMPYQKPVRLVSECIAHYSQSGQIVFDPFLGSGTSLVACEKLGRVCCGCEIDPAILDIALKRFQKEVKGGKEFLQNAKGVLIFPRVIKAGLGIGGEYGEGALRINGRTVDYYSTAAGSIGIQLGGQTKIVIVCFMEDEALKNFRNSAGWKGGVDGSVAMVNLGAGKSVDTITIRDPIVGFVFGQQGLMFNATLEGAKFTKLVR